jgi:hypothetical protein
MKQGQAIILELDLLTYHSMPTTYDWGLMCELIKNNAPIIGRFNPKPDFDNYIWNISPLEIITSRGWLYQWTKKN